MILGSYENAHLLQLGLLINHPIGSANKMINRANTVCDLYQVLFKLITKKEYDKFFNISNSVSKTNHVGFGIQSVGYY